MLSRRAHLASWAINFAAASALLVCLVIVTLFVDAMLAGTRLRWVVACLFVMSMVSLIAAVTCFLREVYLATHFLRIGPPNPPA